MLTNSAGPRENWTSAEATDMLCLSSPLPTTSTSTQSSLLNRSWVRASDGVYEGLTYFGKSLGALTPFFPVRPFSLPLLFPPLFSVKIASLLSEPLVTRCQPSWLSVAEETHSVLAAGLRTAHWTRLCRSIGMGRLLSCQVLIILNNYREWLITVRRGLRRRKRRQTPRVRKCTKGEKCLANKNAFMFMLALPEPWNNSSRWQTGRDNMVQGPGAVTALSNWHGVCSF